VNVREETAGPSTRAEALGRDDKSSAAIGNPSKHPVGMTRSGLSVSSCQLPDPNLSPTEGDKDGAPARSRQNQEQVKRRRRV
jgi:hypothetical protein